jgi:hypothetical protein
MRPLFDVAVVAAVIVFVVVAYVYAVWESWNDDRVAERDELRQERRAQDLEDEWFDFLDTSR